MDSLVHDVRIALRSLRGAPGFALIAALCIALGIAANVFIWTPLNTLLLRPLPLARSAEVMHLSTWSTDGERRTYGSWSYPDYRDIGTLGGVFTATAAYSTTAWNVGGMETPERLAGARVSSSLFPMLGFTPLLGRFFLPDEELDGRVVVIGSGVWERKFASDSAIVGRAVTIDGLPYTVIGVMQRDVRFPETQDLWLPLAPGDARGRRDWHLYQVAGRLAPGVTLEQADARLAAFMRELAERHPDTNERKSGWVVPMNDLIAREVRALFLIMLGAVGFVLLIACANVANLLLARGTSRLREVAVRLAMGATRGRIVRQLLTESLLLAALGGAVGVLVGVWSVDLFTTHMMPSTVPYWMTFEVDRLVLWVTAGVTLATGVVFGIVPALQLSHPSLSESLKVAGGRSGTAHARVGRTRSSLVVGELALSMVLLVGAALMVRSFLATQRAQLGFDPARLLTFEVSLSGERYATDSSRAALRGVLEERLRAIPGVEAVGAIDNQLIADCCRHAPYHPAGKEYPQGSAPSTFLALASPGYMETMRIALRQGRTFEANEGRGSMRVAIVNELLAEREWPGQPAVGQQLRIGDSNSEPYTVVGVMANLVVRHANEPMTPQVLVPMPESRAGAIWYAMRVAGTPEGALPTVRSVLASLDPDLPLARAGSMEFHIRDRMFQPRVFGSMFAIFAGVALLLATVGLYGVMSYVVAQRTHELGIRMALGATARDVTKLVLGGASRLLAVGLAIGLPAAVLLAQLLRGALYGVSASDPSTFVGITFLLSAVALLASAIPALRATRVDPMTALQRD